MVEICFYDNYNQEGIILQPSVLPPATAVKLKVKHQKSEKSQVKNKFYLVKQV